MKPKHAAMQLRLMGWGFMIFGVIFVTLAFAAYDGFARTLLPIFDWTGLSAGEALTRSGRLYVAIMSGLSVGIGACYAFLVAPLLSAQDKAVRQIAKRGGLIVACTWYAVDSLGSWGAGVPSNVVMNTLFLALIAVPLLLVKFED